jgi:hypothetical protein
VSTKQRYDFYDLKQRSAGEQVQVDLKGSAANVLLLDSANYSAFRSGRKYRYHGGLAKRSPVTLTVPRSGHWCVVVHMQGLRGTVRHTLRDVPRALPEMSYERPRDAVQSIGQVGEGLPDVPSPTETTEKDAFLSHAHKDEGAVADALAAALTARGARETNRITPATATTHAASTSSRWRTVKRPSV